MSKPAPPFAIYMRRTRLLVLCLMSGVMVMAPLSSHGQTEQAPKSEKGGSKVPVQMQKSFATRRLGIVMKWDHSGFWYSSPGALLPGADPQEACADLTAVCRSNNQIPKAFSFRHVGNGKLECRADK